MSDLANSSGQIPAYDPELAAANLGAKLQDYCRLAVELGASKASPVETARIVVDERVRIKCEVPKCFGFNTCANCPPHSLSPERTTRLVAQFSHAVVIGMDVRAEAIVRDRETIGERVDAYKKMFELVSKIESAAFYDGYYLATGFAAGSCKSTFCHKSACAVLQQEKCRYNLIARPSMEAVGMDCFALAASLGWQILPIGSSVEAERVSSGLLMGLVLVS
jgi:predicted metal-binding protein